MGICNRCSSFLCKAVNNINARASVADAWYHTGFALDVRRGLKGLQVQDFRPHPFLSIFFFFVLLSFYYRCAVPLLLYLGT